MISFLENKFLSNLGLTIILYVDVNSINIECIEILFILLSPIHIIPLACNCGNWIEE